MIVSVSVTLPPHSPSKLVVELELEELDELDELEELEELESYESS